MSLLEHALGLDTNIQSSMLEHREATWRNGDLSDWTVQIGERVFSVHRFVLALGERSSTFFFNQFLHATTMGMSTQMTYATRLDIGRAMLCKCISVGGCTCADPVVERMSYIDNVLATEFSTLLEYMYEGSFAPTEQNLIPLWIMADYLQMNGLMLKLDKFQSNLVSHDNAHRLLQTCELLCFTQVPIISSCIATIARHFTETSYESLSLLSPLQLRLLLAHPELPEGSCVSSFLARVICDRIDQLSSEERFQMLSVLNGHKRSMASYVILPDDAMLFLNMTSDSIEQFAVLQERCFEAIAAGFQTIPAVSLKKLSVETLATILDRDELQTVNEDSVLQQISTYVAAHPELTDRQQRMLWKTCRFAFVSSDLLWRTNQERLVPQDLVSSSAIGVRHMTDHRSLPKNASGVFVRRMLPRVGSSFEATGASLLVSNCDRTVCMVNRVGHATIFGRQHVACDSVIPRQVYWEFKLEGSRDVSGIHIGLIIASAKAHCARASLGSTSLLSWAIQCQTGKIFQSGRVVQYGLPSLAHGDTLGMMLSQQDRTGSLKFYKNGKQIGETLNGIKGNVVPAVTLYKKDQQVSIACLPAASAVSDPPIAPAG